jgi:hypothetical protein
MRALATICTALACLTGCNVVTTGVPGSGTARTETRELPAFEEIEFRGLGTLEIEVGPQTPLEITADDNLLPLLITEVQGKRLIIRPKENIQPKVSPVFRVATPDLNKAACGGAGRVRVKNIKGESFDIVQSGAGAVELQGEVTRLTAVVSGVGAVTADKLAAKQASITISGAGSAVVNASDSLQAVISGAGSVEYLGDPQISKNISGVGSLSKRK